MLAHPKSQEPAETGGMFTYQSVGWYWPIVVVVGHPLYQGGTIIDHYYRPMHHQSTTSPWRHTNSMELSRHSAGSLPKRESKSMTSPGRWLGAMLVGPSPMLHWVIIGS